MTRRAPEERAGDIAVTIRVGEFIIQERQT